MGRLIKQKKFGKDVILKMYYFQDGYRIYGYRKRDDGYWYENQAGTYPIKDLKEAKETFNSYKNRDSVLLVFAGLRDRE